MSKMIALTFLVMLTALAPSAVGQEHDFGVLEMGAREAGIGHIRVVREGPEDNQAEWVLNVDVFDLEGHPSGTVEMRYPTPDVTEARFTPADSDEIYRMTSDEVSKLVRIEHVGVETVTFRPLCDPNELSEKGKVGYTSEELEELRLKKLECSKQIEVTGTSKTWQEATAQYEEITKPLAMINMRLRGHFDVITSNDRELRERLERLRRESQRQREQSGARTSNS